MEQLFNDYKKLLDFEFQLSESELEHLWEGKKFKSGKMKDVLLTPNKNILLVLMDSMELEMNLKFGIKWLQNKYLIKFPIIYGIKKTKTDYKVLIQRIYFDIQLKVVDDKLFPFVYDPEEVEFLNSSIQSEHEIGMNRISGFLEFYDTEIESMDVLQNIDHANLVVSYIEAITDFEHIKEKSYCHEYEILLKISTQPTFYFIDFGLCVKENPERQSEHIFDMNGFLGVLNPVHIDPLKKARLLFLNGKISADDYGKFKTKFISHKSNFLTNPKYLIDVMKLITSTEE